MICRLCYTVSAEDRLCKACYELLLAMLETSPEDEHLQRIYSFYVTSSSDT